MRSLAVLNLELGRIARRERTYWLRTIYLSILATVVALAWLNQQDSRISWSDSEVVGRHLLHVFALAQFLLLNLAAPLFLCTAISDERARGTLPVLLTTRLSSIQIAFGKLLGGLLPILLLLLAGLPILFLLLVFGGLSWPEVVWISLSTLSCASFGAAAALFFSAFTRQAYQAYLATAAIVLAMALLPGRSEIPWLIDLGMTSVEPSPFRAFFRFVLGDGIRSGWWLLPSVLTCLLSVALLTLGAALPLRREKRTRSLLPLGSRRRRHWPANWQPGNPVLIRDQGGAAAAVRKGMRSALWWFLASLAAVLLFWPALRPLSSGLISPGPPILLMLALVPVFLQPLILGVQAFADEKERGTWHVLLSTPLTSSRIALGKAAGTLLQCLPTCAGFAALLLILAVAGVIPGWIPPLGAAMAAVYAFWTASSSLLAGLLVGRRAWGVLAALSLMLLADVLLLPIWLLRSLYTLRGEWSQAFALYWWGPGWFTLLEPFGTAPELLQGLALHLVLHLVEAALMLGLLVVCFDRAAGRAS